MTTILTTELHTGWLPYGGIRTRDPSSLVASEGFEPPALCFEDTCSTPLSYEAIGGDAEN